MTEPDPNAEPARKLRLCDVCGGLDSHPRHVTSVPPNTPGTVPDDAFLEGLPDGVPPLAVAELMDSATFVRHMDCCASNGCAICQSVMDASGNAQGDALLTHIQSEG